MFGFHGNVVDPAKSRESQAKEHGYVTGLSAKTSEAHVAIRLIACA